MPFSSSSLKALLLNFNFFNPLCLSSTLFLSISHIAVLSLYLFLSLPLSVLPSRYLSLPVSATSLSLSLTLSSPTAWRVSLKE